MAANSLVLLKNDPLPGSSAKVLPANPASLNNVVVVGDLANTVTLGGYSGDPTLQVNAVQGITAAVKAANPNATVTFDACGTSTTATAAASCSAQTQAAIKTADLVVVFVGTDASTAGEGNDRASLAMPGNYDSLISQVAALGNPRTVLSMQTDGPVDIENVKGDFPAIVYSAYNGESQGTALADVLFGKQNPSGHLDFTWYKDDSQLPSIKNYGLNPADTGGLGRTYQYFTGTPTYPFGYGLSYTDFAYSKVQAADHADAQGKATVRFDVTNTGKTPGATVAQLYITPPSVPGTQQPAEQLEGFAKTAVLKPGQTQHLSVSVNVADLRDMGRAERQERRHRRYVHAAARHRRRRHRRLPPAAGHRGDQAADPVCDGAARPGRLHPREHARPGREEPVDRGRHRAGRAAPERGRRRRGREQRRVLRRPERQARQATAAATRRSPRSAAPASSPRTPSAPRRSA